MRIGPDETIWIVTDPERGSDSVGTILATTLRDLAATFMDGVEFFRNPTLHTERAGAEADAAKRRSAVPSARRGE